MNTWKLRKYELDLGRIRVKVFIFAWENERREGEREREREREMSAKLWKWEEKCVFMWWKGGWPKSRYVGSLEFDFIVIKINCYDYFAK
jgi:hypothetical protein